MKPIFIEAVGVIGPGLAGWEQARAVLTGAAPYVPAPVPPLKPTLLPPDVRRRTTDHIRLAVEVAAEATQSYGDKTASMTSVFASAEGDGAIAHDICFEVAKESPQVSPTRFHNSVTNAAAGYWCIAVRSQAPSTSVAGYDGTVAVGLLETCLQVLTDAPTVLLVIHDEPMPAPLHGVRPMSAPFGAALVFARERSPRAMAQLEVELTDASTETTLGDPRLETLRLGNPAARALPLLAALAARQNADIHFPYLHSRGLLARIKPLS
jgi:hypothetical protein